MSWLGDMMTLEVVSGDTGEHRPNLRPCRDHGLTDH